MADYPVAKTIARFLRDMDAENMPNERRAEILAAYCERPNDADRAWAAGLAATLPPMPDDHTPTNNAGEAVAWRVRSKRHDGSWSAWYITEARPDLDDFESGYGVEIRELVDRAPTQQAIVSEGMMEDIYAVDVIVNDYAGNKTHDAWKRLRAALTGNQP